MTRQAPDDAATSSADGMADLLFEQSMLVTAVVGFDGLFRRIGRGITEILGWEPEDLVGTSAFEIIHPDDRERAVAEMAALASGTRTLGYEVRERAKDGSYRWILASVRPLEGEDAVLATGIDINERRAGEALLAMQTAALESFVAGAPPDAIIDMLITAVEAQIDGGTLRVIPHGASDDARTAAAAVAADYPATTREGDLVARVVLERDHPASEREATLLSAAARLVGLVLGRGRVEASSSHHAAIVASSADAIIGATLEGVITSWSPGATAMFGYEEHEAIGRPISLILPPGQEGAQADLRRRASAGETIQDVMTERRHKDGSVIPVSLTLSVIRDAAGEQTGYSGILRNATERVRAAEAMRRSRDFHLTLLDALPVMIWRSDATGRADWFNSAWREFTGRDDGNDLGDGWADHVHADDLDRCMATYRAAFEARRAFEMEYRIKRHDGAWRWVIDNGQPYRDIDGSFGGFIGGLIDVTDQRVALQRQARLVEILEATPDLVGTAAPDGTVTYLNAAARRTAGLPARGGLGHIRALDLLPSRLHEAFLREVIPIVDERGVWVGETSIVGGDGTETPVLQVVIAHRDAGGRVEYYSTIARDISERKRTEQRLARREAQLAEAQQMARLGSWEWNVQTDEVEWSDEQFNVFGLRPGSFKPTFESFVGVVHPGDRAHVQQVLRRAVDEGKPFELEFRATHADGGERIVLARGRPLQDDHGAVRRMLGTAQDVTEQRAAERAMRAAEDAARRLAEHRRLARVDREFAERLQALNHAFIEIGRALGVEGTTARIAEQAATVVGANVGIVVLMTGTRVLMQVFTLDRPSGTTFGDQLAEGLLDFTDSVGGGVRLTHEELQAHPAWPQLATAIGSTPLRGLLAATLTTTTGDPIGVVALSDRRSSEFTETDLATLVQIAQMASIAVEKARRYEHEHEVAETLQRSFLPDRLPTPIGARLAARYVAGGPGVEIGGDWYDAIDLDGRRVALVIGDVEGHGLRAAATMGQLRNTVRAYALDGYGPAEALERLNSLADRIGDGQFSTLLIGILDLDTRAVTFATAGHPPPLLLPADGPARYLEGTACPPLGALPGARYFESHATIGPDDLLLLYTDGLIESRVRGLEDGMARLAKVAASTPCDDPEDLLALLVAEVPDPRQRDDIAVLALQMVPASLTMRMPAEPTQLVTLRRKIRSYLIAMGVDEGTVFELVLACSEVAANAVEHPVDRTGSMVDVSASFAGGVVEIAVRDHGRWRPQRESTTRGRGLSIAHALADVRIDRSDAGTTVTLSRMVEGGR